MAVTVALAVGGAMLLGSACGGTLEDDYRRGRLRPSGPSEDTEEQDPDSAAPDAHGLTTTPSSIGDVGERAPRVNP